MKGACVGLESCPFLPVCKRQGKVIYAQGEKKGGSTDKSSSASGVGSGRGDRVGGGGEDYGSCCYMLIFFFSLFFLVLPH